LKANSVKHFFDFKDVGAIVSVTVFLDVDNSQLNFRLSN